LKQQCGALRMPGLLIRRDRPKKAPQLVQVAAANRLRVNPGAWVFTQDIVVLAIYHKFIS